MQLDGKVAIVTGGAGGIGAAIAQALVTQGARVVVTDLNQTSLETVATGIATSVPGAVASIAGDATSTTHIDAVIELAESRFGPVDLYFAN
ncbi:SDR family NAD(P)-dependent oxidoreductase, partial [Streptomyces sp. SID10244]|nr:SDR family NAD(P)-dependent oxidoreductase [Streptomyces sp. SID10244]